MFFAFFPSGRGLNDSPVGLAAYILEKFSTWTSHDFRNLEDGGLTRYLAQNRMEGLIFVIITVSFSCSFSLKILY